MKFSGHETFHIREGWLHKGLKLLHDDPDKYHDPYMHDWLGVGSNMGKSIQHWLLATKLAERASGTNGAPILSELGTIILAKDPYFLSPFTWWILHINLVNGVDLSTSFHWFFNHFSQTRFKKEHCVHQLLLYLSRNGANVPGIKTLERDVSCLLSSYARIIPEGSIDPEENYNCPFRELGMLSYFRDTNAYHLVGNNRNIPGHALAYCLSLSTQVSVTEIREVSIADSATAINGPGRCFGLSPNAIFELMETTVQYEPECRFSLVTLAGKHMIQFPNIEPNQWVARYFEQDVGSGYGH